MFLNFVFFYLCFVCQIIYFYYGFVLEKCMFYIYVPLIVILPFIGGRNSFNLPQGNVDTEIERPEYSFLWPTQYWGKIFLEEALQFLYNTTFSPIKKCFIIILKQNNSIETHKLLLYCSGQRNLILDNCTFQKLQVIFYMIG